MVSMQKNHDIDGAKILRLFGISASRTAKVLPIFKAAFPSVGIELDEDYPDIRIKLNASSDNPEQLDVVLNKACKWLAGELGDKIFSDRGESMAEVAGRLLIGRNETLSVAESCTGGLISNLLTDVPGSSAYFLFGGVTYSNQAKMKVLNVAAETIRTVGAVHEKTAEEMAAGVRMISGATYGISTSGIAGPDGGTPEKPVGTVCLGIATPEAAHGYRYCFPRADRAVNKQIFALAALDLLRRHLCGLAVGQYF